MKKPYIKPVLVKAGKLAQTAAPVIRR